ncbi:ABC transporter ATP-binding protein [Burkholderia anthina]|uniref:ABC transporter ATP-binding protein n=1 Tax=Burkholderia anthina TaxID=179879 RepID=A0A6P2G9U0_9BURK|nr:ABC transporter ATP-binding protein [Burkholderia anthina]MBM2770367.1 ABC transporter ATP-binding protein [Burkholderia anthina]QTD92055.1 ABC transporter ATP-binding protein [Burkholderia anthina]VVU49754.1 branched-chain amino acid ABC transporter ATPase [Burkholderia anthina]
MIAVNNVVAGYTRDVDILRGISITAKELEIVTILGPNGCGKSTLLKTVAGFLLPREGTVTLDERNIGQVPVFKKVRKHDIGFVPQTDNVFGALSVWENLMLGGQFMPDHDKKQRLEALCDAYPVLRRKLRARASSLSGGERQILSLARALMPRPRFLLLDEPSAGLSPKMLVEVFDAIVKLRDAERIGVLMVEQNATEALRISDRTYVLSMGQVALEGKASALLESDEMRRLYLGGRSH